ncbi:NADPH-dependent FMN reductase [Herbaspirillum camelliae]|uniref:NADPH-dependent FMN reductase n=1 Tax=Herbaspirillum camelliae TaxID=1892903 RepID=UPI000949D2C4|nr:NADPH-dependent FMN reductase [Herbaspirillum camelliae]
MQQSKDVFLIMGSTRMGRNCPAITSWVAEIGKGCTDLSYEIIDLCNWHLPMDDEDGLPALRTPYRREHTRAWSGKVASAAAVVFVTPQYNWGYPAVLKNSLDHLYHEWRDKPTAIVTYGGHGGTRCAKQLRQVAASLKMSVVSTSPTITLSDAVIRENAPFIPDREFLQYKPKIQSALRELADKVHGREHPAKRLLGEARRLLSAF